MARWLMVPCLLLTCVGVVAAQTAEAAAAAPDHGAAPAAAQAPESPPSPAHEAAAAVQAAFEEVASKALASVVTLRAYVREPENGAAPEPAGTSGWIESAVNDDYPGFTLRASGSGFFVSEDGDILTCAHQLQKHDGSLVDLVDVETQDQRHFISEVVGVEPTVNLAIVRLRLFPEGYPPKFEVARLGDSGALKPGRWAIAVGDPAGPEKFVGVGVFSSGASRDCYQELRSAFYLQLSMTAHPEAYGGPVLDLDGNVLGILAPRDPQPGPVTGGAHYGIEFAMPSNIVVGLYHTIKQKGSFKSPWLGFSVMARSELIKERGHEAFEALNPPRFGIFIEDVFEPSPARAADIQPGDFLVSFGGVPIHAPIDFQRQLYLTGIGREAQLEIFHAGETRLLSLTVEERPAEAVPR